jgi:hypothetical protein
MSQHTWPKEDCAACKAEHDKIVAIHTGVIDVTVMGATMPKEVLLTTYGDGRMTIAVRGAMGSWLSEHDLTPQPIGGE